MKAIKKPIEVDVWKLGSVNAPAWVLKAFDNRTVRYGVWEDAWLIKTLEGEMWAYNGDYLIKGVLGELYPCKKEAFEATYEITEY